jgi:hypothetical protein
VIWATDFWGYIDSNQVEFAEHFVNDIESQLGLTHVKVSFVNEWAKSPPPEAEGASLDDYMVPVSFAFVLPLPDIPIDTLWQAAEWVGYFGYHSSDTFREKHREKFGTPPYVSPPNRKAW